MQRLKRDPFLVPVTIVFGNQLILAINTNPVYIPLDEYPPVRVANRHGVVIAIKANQRESSHGGRSLSTGFEIGRRKLNQGGLILLEKFSLNSLLAPNPSPQILPTTLLQVGVEFLEAVKLRHGNEVVQAGILDDPLCML